MIKITILKDMFLHEMLDVTPMSMCRLGDIQGQGIESY